MNISILGCDAVAGGGEVDASSRPTSWSASGDLAPASLVTVLMLWTAFASVFSLLLGYSRVPYAAALDGDYFKVFARVHPKHQFPHVSLLVLGGAAIGLLPVPARRRRHGARRDPHHRRSFWRRRSASSCCARREPDLPRPFRMWLYPVPALLAFLGFVYIVVMRPKSIESIRLAIVVVIVGTVLFVVRRRLASSRLAVRSSRFAVRGSRFAIQGFERFNDK